MLLFGIFLTCFSYVLADDPIITLPDGQIRGIAATTDRNKVPFYAYLGIPFAAPPVGNLRFQPPQSPEKWDGIFDAKTNSKICYQVAREIKGETEDCLYINVYTPELIYLSFYYIYGGAFIHGYAMIGLQRPEFMLEQNIVLVTVNYRVGPFGFLSTGDTVIPGNMGLKDQQFGLKWVQQNIHLFGGDPNQVTIMGQSAGGASVTYQILSPSSAGLFRAAISESASALCDWAYQRNARDVAYGIAAEIDSSFTSDRSSEDLLQFLQSVDASAIDNNSDTYKAFAPVIEVAHDGAMITESMYEAVANGRINKVPLLIGINSEEEISLAASKYYTYVLNC
ncbi:hypothetical protein NQ318_007279 [Aromia moschata]|uniref:Carboxylic ester hydrolase n=1 Tax=Aromia moschata TaxID=1265417 RepID=A0AAV8YZ75_9CUCU|nr:hypothetical protein NQ318_007279 [Aromia moschata]